MSKKSTQPIKIIVQGATAFPIDMLRYDRAWPRTERDSLKIASTWDGGAGLQEIELLSLDMPNHDRWVSFGWKVFRVESLL